jgi:hypothetical protein
MGIVSNALCRFSLLSFMPYHRLCLRETYAALDVEYMGTLGEKQDKPIYAKASPRRWVIYWQRLHLNRHKGNGQSWQRLQLAYILAIFTLEPIPCRYASHESRAHWQHLHRPQCTAWSTFHAQQPQPGAPTGNNAR